METEDAHYNRKIRNDRHTMKILRPYEVPDWKFIDMGNITPPKEGEEYLLCDTLNTDGYVALYWVSDPKLHDSRRYTVAIDFRDVGENTIWAMHKGPEFYTVYKMANSCDGNEFCAIIIKRALYARVISADDYMELKERLCLP